MTPDGISTEDWDRVHAAAIGIVNASSMDDNVLTAHRTEQLFELLDNLEEQYGRVPSLIATKADFIDDPESAIALHQEALSLSVDPLSKRLSLQSLVSLMIDQRYNHQVIESHLSELMELTLLSEDDSDREELLKLRASLQALKSAR